MTCNIFYYHLYVIRIFTAKFVALKTIQLSLQRDAERNINRGDWLKPTTKNGRRILTKNRRNFPVYILFSESVIKMARMENHMAFQVHNIHWLIRKCVSIATVLMKWMPVQRFMCMSLFIKKYGIIYYLYTKIRQE